MSRPNAAPPEEEHGSCRQYSERGCYHGPVPARRANGLAGASGGSWGGGAGGGGGGGQVHRGLRQAGGCARCGGPDWKRSRWRAYGRRDADDLRTAWRKLCCANCVPSPALYSPARRMRERIGRPLPDSRPTPTRRRGAPAKAVILHQQASAAALRDSSLEPSGPQQGQGCPGHPWLSDWPARSDR